MQASTIRTVTETVSAGNGWQRGERGHCFTAYVITDDDSHNLEADSLAELRALIREAERDPRSVYIYAPVRIEWVVV